MFSIYLTLMREDFCLGLLPLKIELIRCSLSVTKTYLARARLPTSFSADLSLN
jgi:hypothetical protein